MGQVSGGAGPGLFSVRPVGPFRTASFFPFLSSYTDRRDLYLELCAQRRLGSVDFFIAPFFVVSAGAVAGFLVLFCTGLHYPPGMKDQNEK